MKLPKILLAAVAGIAVAAVALFYGMAERVEVVVLHSHDDAGEHRTRLWVVDDAGSAWLRTGRDNGSWLPRLRTHPAIELERGGATRPFTAVVVDDPETVARINQRSLEKYGWSEQLLRAGGDAPGAQVAIRLDPTPASPR